MSATRLDFEVVDVFTDRAFQGNPLAVVSGAEDLTTEQLQAIAREFALSETAFPLAPTPEEAARGVHYRLRIFTPSQELPFAGHPSVGTAWLLAERGRVQRGRVVQTCGAGDLPLLVPEDGGLVTLSGGTPTLGAALDAAEVASSVGLSVHDLAGPPVQLAGTGADFCYLHVDAGALARARLVSPEAVSGFGVYVVAWPGTDDWPRTDAEAGAILPQPVRARLLAPDLAAEDPATGSAALGLAVHAVANGLLPADGTSSVEVVQGVEIGRPSHLFVEVDARDGQAIAARVSGHVVPVSAGTIAVPSFAG